MPSFNSSRFLGFRLSRKKVFTSSMGLKLVLSAGLFHQFTLLFAKKTAECKKGNVVVASKVVLEWGKSKKSYKAAAVSFSNIQVPTTASRIEEEEPFTSELAAPAQQTTEGVQQSTEAILKRLD